MRLSCFRETKEIPAPTPNWSALLHAAVGKEDLLELMVLCNDWREKQELKQGGGDDNDDEGEIPLAHMLECRHEGETLLLHACRKQLWEMAVWLINRGADVNAAQQDVHHRSLVPSGRFIGDTPLHNTCKHRASPSLLGKGAQCTSIDVTRLLLDKGANIHAEDVAGQTPVHHAAANWVPSVLGLLLDRGADMLVGQDNPRTRLPWFSIRSVPVLEMVLKRHPFLLEYTDRHGHGCLYWAQSVEVLRSLLDHGADPNAGNKQGFTSLHSCGASWRSYRHFELLIERGADVHARTTDKLWTPLHNACAGPYDLVAQLLINNGADISARDWQGETPLAVLCRQPRNVSFLRVMLKKGALVNTQNEDGQTPLHLLCGYKRDDYFARQHFKMQQQQRRRQRQLRRPLVTAMLHSVHDTIFGLSNDDDEFQLSDNVKYATKHVECLLLDHKGAHHVREAIHMADKNGRTPLHIACQTGGAYIVSLLLGRGAFPTARDNKGNTPVHDACLEGNWSLLPILLGRRHDLDGFEALSMKNHKEQLPSHGVFLHDDAPLDLLFYAVNDLSPQLGKIAESSCAHESGISSSFAFMSLW